jgi:hypothetical protein
VLIFGLRLFYPNINSGKMKFKRIFLSLLTVLVLTITSSQFASASTSIEKPADLSDVVDYENLQILETDGSVSTFDNLEDMEKYVSYLEETKNTAKPGGSKSIIQPQVFGETVVGTQYKDYQFMGYSKYTKYWQKKPIHGNKKQVPKISEKN